MEPLWPQPAPINSYGDGGFRFAELRHAGGIFVMPSGIFPWKPRAFDEVTVDDFAPALGCGCDIPFILFGMGEEHRPPPHWLLQATVLAGLGLECMTTAAAVRTYNVCMDEARVPATFLLPVS